MPGADENSHAVSPGLFHDTNILPARWNSAFPFSPVPTNDTLVPLLKSLLPPSLLSLIETSCVSGAIRSLFHPFCSKSQNRTVQPLYVCIVCTYTRRPIIIRCTYFPCKFGGYGGLFNVTRSLLLFQFIFDVLSWDKKIFHRSIVARLYYISKQQ